MTVIIDLSKYVAIATNSSFCPTCCENVVLLQPKSEPALAEPELPSFYICPNGSISVVGRGPAVPCGEDEKCLIAVHQESITQSTLSGPLKGITIGVDCSMEEGSIIAAAFRKYEDGTAELMDLIAIKNIGQKDGLNPEPSPFPPEIETMGQAIRWLRKQRGLSLRTLGTKVGLSAPFLSDLEHGRRGTDQLDVIAEALNVDVAHLKRLDGRIPRELQEWLEANPKYVDLLRRMKDGYVPPMTATDNRSRRA